MKYIQKITGPNTIESYLGQTVHTAIETLHNRMMLDELMRLPDLLKFFKEKFQPGSDVINVKGLEIDSYVDLGITCLANYYSDNYPFKNYLTLSNEMHVQGKIGKYSFQGYIDRKAKDEETLVIIDYKTGNDLPTAVEVKHSLQLSLYEILVRQMEGFTGKIRQELHFIRHRKVFKTERTEAQLEDAKERLLKTIDEIEEAVEIDHFPYRANFLCDWCEYNADCATYYEYKNQ